MQATRDDRVLRTTRVVCAAIVPVLTSAFVILFLFPGQTRTLWAWTIRSRMTCMLMGGGYLAGALFFLRAARARQWHRLGPGIVATTVFATMLGLATFLHWSDFNHGHVSFWAWTLLYVSTPLLLPVLYVRNRAYDPGTPGPDDVAVPDWVRVGLTVLGAGQLLFALVLFARPSLVAEHWPWPLSALTARSLAAFAAFPAVAYLAFAFERRWSGLRWPFETAIVGLALIAVGAARSTGEFRDGGWAAAWTVGLVVGLAFLVTVRVVMARRPATVGE